MGTGGRSAVSLALQARLCITCTRNATHQARRCAEGANVLLSQKSRIKRGGNPVRIDLADINLAVTSPDERVLLVDHALTRLEQLDPEGAQVVTLKFFGDYTTSEIAGILNVGERTVERRWTYARARLMQLIKESS